MKKMLLLFCAFLVVILTYGQVTWSSSNDIASSSFGNDRPRVVYDRSGDALVLWGANDNAYFAKWNGSSFNTPVKLNPTGMQVAQANWMGPEIASHGDTVYVAFKEIPETSDTCQIYCMRSFDGGNTFSAPVQVTFIADSISRFPAITTDDNGHPIITFMKFDANFGEARWAVARSNDFGSTFQMDVKASGWSSPTSEVCDCCPGAIASSGNYCAVMYRDNNSNIRDTWVGVSSDNGNTFTGGFNADQENWLLMSCPSSGPDGFIEGDTLYSVFMSGASSVYRVYYNKTSLLDMNSSGGTLVTNTFAGIYQQNYIRMDHSGNAAAMVWKQNISGTIMLAINFTNDYTASFSTDYDTVAINNVTTTDVAMNNGNIIVVWEDDATGTVKYRTGTYSAVAAIEEQKNKIDLTIAPNPFSDETVITIHTEEKGLSYEVYDATGKLVRTNEKIQSNRIRIERNELSSGIYHVVVKSGEGIVYSEKLVVK